MRIHYSLVCLQVVSGHNMICPELMLVQLLRVHLFALLNRYTSMKNVLHNVILVAFSLFSCIHAPDQLVT